MLLMNILPFFAGSASLIMAAIVMLSKRDQNKYPFILFAVGMGAWAVLITCFLFSTSSANAELIARWYYVAAAFIFYGLLLFCLSFTGASASWSLVRLSLLLLVPLVIISWIIFLPGYISVKGVELGARSVSLDPLLYASYCIYAAFHIIWFNAQLIKVLRARAGISKRKKSQVRTISLVILLCIPFGALFNLLLPYFGNYELIMLGPLAILPVVAVTFYSMKRHGLFDIKAAAVRSLVYSFSIITLAASYYVMAYFVSVALFQKQDNQIVSASPLNVFLALILAFVFQPIKQFFDKVTDRIFYRDQYDTSDFLIRIGRILTSTTELQEILGKVGLEIRQTLKASGSLFLVYRDNHPNKLVGEGIERDFSASILKDLDTLAAAHEGGLIIVDRLGVSDSPEEKRVHSVLAKKRIALVLPLVSADETIGYLMLGEHLAGMYSKQDTGALQAIANELVIAVQNARAVQAIRDLNAHLEQRIEDATQELRKNNLQLRQADEAKDEFVSMASHQLRTPLTSIKGYISMVLEGDVGKITPLQRQLLGEAFTSSERMVHLISDFLNVSRLQTGKFMIDKSLVNLADLVEQEVAGLKATAEAHSLKLKFRKPSYFPSLYIDEGKVHQVVMNFIDNAIYYSAENSAITVKLRKEGSDVIFEVHDTGIGVPQEEQERLFTKFFRATNARRQRPDGTGIGLFLAKKVITAHGGSMVFESVEGEGSTFGFRLPIKKLSEPPAKEN